MDRHFLRDRRAHRRANDMSALYAERVQQTDHIGRHITQTVGRLDGLPRQCIFQELRQRRRRPVDLRGFTDIAIVEANNEKAALCERGAESVIPEDHVRPEAHDQKERQRVEIAERVVAKLDPIRLRELFRRMGKSCLASASSPKSRQTKARSGRAFEYSHTTFADYAARGKTLARFSRALVAPSATRSLT